METHLNFNGSATLSSEFLQHLYDSFDLALELQKKGTSSRRGINGVTRYGPGCFSLAVCAWEAFLYETLITPRSRHVVGKDSPLWDLPMDKVENWDILTKTRVFPKLILGTGFNRGEMPFQDFEKLVCLRNTVVHFRMWRNVNQQSGPSIEPFERAKKAIRDLVQRGIALRSTRDRRDMEFPWPTMISTTECIRWSINVLYEMADALRKMDQTESLAAFGTFDNFRRIERDAVVQWFVSNGLDISEDAPGEGT